MKIFLGFSSLHRWNLLHSMDFFSWIEARRGLPPCCLLPSLTAFVTQHLTAKYLSTKEVTFSISSCFLTWGESDEDSSMLCTTMVSLFLLLFRYYNRSQLGEWLFSVYSIDESVSVSIWSPWSIDCKSLSTFFSNWQFRAETLLTLAERSSILWLVSSWNLLMVVRTVFSWLLI